MEYLMNKLLTITAATALALAAGVASAEPYEGFPPLKDRDFCKDMNAFMKFYEQYGYSEQWLEQWLKTNYPAWSKKFEHKCERRHGERHDDRDGDR